MSENQSAESILIKNGLVITMDDEIGNFQGDIYIDEGEIKEANCNIKEADTVIDATDKLVLPGFIQTHVHLNQVLFRGLADDMDVVDWLREKIWPLEESHDENTIYNSARLGIAELIAGGTTTILTMETTSYTDRVFQALKESGIRAICGNALMDVEEPGTIIKGKSISESLSESKKLLHRWHEAENGRLKYAITPRGPRNCSPELMMKIKEISRKYDLLIHSHAAENGDLAKKVRKKTGVGDIELFQKLGLAGPELVLAHCIWLTDNELQILEERDVKVTHCPSANLKLSSGLAKIPEMLNRNLNVSLGADGAPCNNNLDIFNEMRLASLIHKPKYGPTAMKAETVLKMATIGGAKTLGLEEEVGSITPGKKADIVVLDRDEFHCSPGDGVPISSQIVYSMKSSNVSTTIVDGKIVYNRGKLLTMNKEKILTEASRSIKSILKKVSFGPEMLNNKLKM